MSNLEPGCKAIIINGVMSRKYPTNIGKIVTVGNFIGMIPSGGADDYWEVNKPMTRQSGDSVYANREKNMQRLDDHDTENYFKSKKELITTL